MRTSPHLRNHRQNPIILIGHSLGGLVIKKAYIESREQKADPEFAARIQSVFFLATPHRGSDYASTLSNVLKISGFLSSREYLSELTTGSASIQLINQDFARYAGDLHIFSFFETLRMSLGGLASALIVDKSSAILGPEFKMERVQYLDANHRDVCKFDGLDDPNYLRVRDSLSTALEILLRNPRTDRDAAAKAQLATLQSYLGVPGRPEGHHVQMEGSCRWIEHRDDFQQWLAGGGTNPSFYVMTAQPGAGKTVLATHVISQLKALNMSCAFHYLQSGNDHGQSLAGLLRSIAYQMAATTTAFRDVLLRLHNDGSTFAMDDARTIWVNIFKEGLFRTPSLNPQYWVIDGLDECPKYSELFTLLKGEVPLFPLRVMITSRVMPDIPRLLKTLDRDLAPIEIPESDTLGDIQAYIQSRADALPVETEEERGALSAKILAKSGACFLWVRLVLDELQEVYGFESIMEILDGIPEGMVPYYQRATDLLQTKRNSEKLIAKAILRWVVTAARPLLTSELAEALQLESRETKLQQSVKSAVEGLCGSLVQVHANNVVQLVHLTAREFLLSSDAKEFQVVKAATHERIALTCIGLLSAAGFRPPRHRRLLHQPRKWSSPLLDYAATNFSQHVYSASAESNKLLLALHGFLKTNVLTWIEHVARQGDLHCLLKTARNLRGYLDRRVKYEPPISLPVKTIGDWSIDLTRLVTRFGSALMSSPSSIYFVIPPMAPKTSAIFTQFGTSPDGMSLVGQDNVAWDDCLASIRLDGETAATLACGVRSIAVGCMSGEVVLYHHQSFQKQLVLHHETSVERLHFDQTGKLLITSSKRRLAAWDLDGRLQWEHRWQPTRSLVLLTSSRDSIIAFTTTGRFLRWDSSDGTFLEDQVYPYRTPEQGPGGRKPLSRAASFADISPNMDVLAITYMAQPICLWFCQTNDFIGWAIDDRGGHPVAVIFNPNPDIDRLLVAYRDCHLALYDSFTGARIVSTVGDHLRQVGLLCTTVSLDGRTIASVDRHGLLSIRDFETLSLLFYVASPDSAPRTLRFSQDSSSIVDTTESVMRVWSPSVLNRKLSGESASVSDEATELPAVQGQSEAGRAARFITICAHATRRLIVAGKYGGDIVAYSSVTGKETGLLYSHPHGAYTGITALTLSVDNLVASGDTYGNVLVYELDSTLPAVVGTSPVKLRVQINSTAKQLLFLPGGDLLLVSTADCDSVFSLKEGKCVGQLQSDQGRGPWRWILDPGGPNRKPGLFLVENKVLKQFDLTSFPTRADADDMYLDYDLGQGVEETSIALATVLDNMLILDTRRRQGYAETASPLLFDMTAVETRGSKRLVSPLPLASRLAQKVRRMVVPRPDLKSHEQLLFLGDSNWLSGVSLASPDAATYTRHFPVPNDYVAQDRVDEVLPVRTIDDDIVFSLRGELAVIKNGLKHEDVRPL
jgi:hypothetical protein